MPLFPPLPNNPENQNFEKMKKASGDVIILNLCNKKHDQMMYAYSDMECSHRYDFRPFFAVLLHYWSWKLKFGKNIKKHLEILSFYACVPLIKITCTPDMMYGSWDMKFNRQNYSELFWKYQKWKKTLEISSFNTIVPKFIILCYTFPEMWHQTDVIVHFSFWAIFSPFARVHPKKWTFQKK